MKKFKQLERGQAIYLIAIGIVAMMGFTALSIDGGRLYAERRQAQNAADAAAFAAAFGIIEETDNSTGASMAAASAAGMDSANGNGYDNDGVTNTVTINYPPMNYANNPDDDIYAEGPNKMEYVQVKIWKKVDTSLIQFVYEGPTELEVEAIARVVDADPDILGNAIVAMSNCDGSEVIGVTGGGVSGGVQAFNGGIFVNASDDGSCCALDPPNNGYGITSDVSIASVASCDYSGETMMSPVPIETMVNNGKKVGDPLGHLPEPQCTANGTKVGNTLYPGYYSKGTEFSGEINLEPGIYCIDDAVKLSGNETITGYGVVLYFMDKGSLAIVGNGGYTLTAPNDSNCLGTEGDPTASCTYKGITIFVTRTNTRDFDVRGNGSLAAQGMIYALNATVQAKGGGTDPDETEVTGQIICARILGNGNGSFKVTYDDDWTYNVPPLIELAK